MGNRIISYDLGTGGNKALLYDFEGNCLASVFIPYDTIYPRAGWHEQRPEDWWHAVVLAQGNCSKRQARTAKISNAWLFPGIALAPYLLIKMGAFSEKRPRYGRMPGPRNRHANFLRILMSMNGT